MTVNYKLFEQAGTCISCEIKRISNDPCLFLLTLMMIFNISKFQYPNPLYVQSNIWHPIQTLTTQIRHSLTFNYTSNFDQKTSTFEIISKSPYNFFRHIVKRGIPPKMHDSFYNQPRAFIFPQNSPKKSTSELSSKTPMTSNYKSFKQAGTCISC